MIGRTLSHYRIVEKLGEGGMGQVYLAEDSRLRRRVALKVLSSEFSSDPERLSRFRQEAVAVARLNHPHIVTIYSVEEADGLHFLTMERVEGESLDRLIPKTGFSMERFFAIATPLAEALAAAHEQGVVHRDLKPANVMVAGDGPDAETDIRLKVLDFGLAKLRPSPVPAGPSSELPTYAMTTPGSVMGTVPYMSPEQVQGQAVDHRTDIFSLGILLYEMAAGRRPFAGENSASLISSILRDRPPEVSDLRDDVPRHLGRIIAHCLKKNPKQRFQTARDVANELRGLRDEMREQSGRATRAAARPAPAASSGRRRAALAAGAAALTVVSAIALWVWRGGLDPGGGPASPGVTGRRTMIVVLPFENLGPPEDAYFAAGITEEITSRLAAASGLGVISRKSARQYAGTDKTVAHIGDELGVDYVLEGTVSWARSGEGPGRVKITPQLIRVADNTNQWADVYDRVLDDIFAVQTDVALSVLRELGVALQQPEEEILEARPTQDLDAYTAYLRGLDARNRNERDLAVEMLERAVALDSQFAAAHAQLALVHGGFLNLISPVSEEARREHCAKARLAAERTVQIDPGSSHARIAMGYYVYSCERDFERALEELHLAAAQRPNDVEVLTIISVIRQRQGLPDEAIETLTAAVELAPRDPGTVSSLAFLYRSLRRYEEADDWFARWISLAPDQESAYGERCWNALLNGDVAAARAVVDAMPSRRGWFAVMMWILVDLYEHDYRAALETIRSQPAEAFNPAFSKSLFEAIVLSSLDDPEARAAWEGVRQELEAMLAAVPDELLFRLRLAWAYGRLGRRAEAIQEIERVLAAGPIAEDPVRGPRILLDVAWAYAFAGDWDGALDYLDLLLSTPATGSFVSVPLLQIDQFWDPIRDHPRFQELLREHAGRGPAR